MQSRGGKRSGRPLRLGSNPSPSACSLQDHQQWASVFSILSHNCTVSRMLTLSTTHSILHALPQTSMLMQLSVRNATCLSFGKLFLISDSMSSPPGSPHHLPPAFKGPSAGIPQRLGHPSTPECTPHLAFTECPFPPPRPFHLALCWAPLPSESARLSQGQHQRRTERGGEQGQC